MEGTVSELKHALLKCAAENENKPTYTGYVVVSSVCKAAAERIEFLNDELEKERKINEHIKSRFVKCNTCTDEMKNKCLMFNENLCEGERCEELVDLVALVTDNDKLSKIAKAKRIIEEFMRITECVEGFEPDYSELINEAQALLTEE